MKLKLPIIIINFKAYKTSIGRNAVRLAKICESVSGKYKASIGVAVQAPDIFRVYEKVKIPVFAQHIDPVYYGKHTGAIIPEDIKLDGAVGTLINHSEKRLRFGVIKKTVLRAKENKLITVVCSPNNFLTRRLVKLKPDFIAVEPPKLIGGKISVSAAQPELIKSSYNIVKKRAKLIVGAGVHTAEDVKVALKLGAKGILAASGITQAKNPRKILVELVKGLRNSYV